MKILLISQLLISSLGSWLLLLKTPEMTIEGEVKIYQEKKEDGYTWANTTKREVKGLLKLSEGNIEVSNPYGKKDKDTIYKYETYKNDNNKITGAWFWIEEGKEKRKYFPQEYKFVIEDTDSRENKVFNQIHPYSAVFYELYKLSGLNYIFDENAKNLKESSKKNTTMTDFEQIVQKYYDNEIQNRIKNYEKDVLGFWVLLGKASFHKNKDLYENFDFEQDNFWEQKLGTGQKFVLETHWWLVHNNANTEKLNANIVQRHLMTSKWMSTNPIGINDWGSKIVYSYWALGGTQNVKDWEEEEKFNQFMIDNRNEDKKILQELKTNINLFYKEHHKIARSWVVENIVDNKDLDIVAKYKAYDWKNLAPKLSFDPSKSSKKKTSTVDTTNLPNAKINGQINFKIKDKNLYNFNIKGDVGAVDGKVRINDFTFNYDQNDEWLEYGNNEYRYNPANNVFKFNKTEIPLDTLQLKSISKLFDAGLKIGSDGQLELGNDKYKYDFLKNIITINNKEYVVKDLTASELIKLIKGELK